MNELLQGVPETMLWTLHNRANEALRPDAIIQDPKCVEIYRALSDYDYVGHFGAADNSHGTRSMLFDEALRAFIAQHPQAVIVNLGEGLETQRYRIDAPETLWFSVDVPEAIEIRERFIAPDDRHRHLAKSALDTSWFEAIPRDRPLMITAQGLFMYFTAAQMAELIAALGQTFPGARLMFDYLSVRYSQKTLTEKGWMKTPHYRTPPMPWGIDRDQLAPTFSQWLGKPVRVHNVIWRMPRGLYRWPILLAEKYCPALLNKAPGICWLDLPQ